MTYLLPELTQDRAAPIPDPTGLSPIAALFAARQVDHLMLTNDFFVNLLDMNTKWEASSTSEGVFEGRDRGIGELKLTGTAWTSSSVRTPSSGPSRKSMHATTRSRRSCVTLWLRGTR